MKLKKLLIIETFIFKFVKPKKFDKLNNSEVNATIYKITYAAVSSPVDRKNIK